MNTLEPIVRLLSVKAEPPSLQDNTGDLDRLKKSVSRHFQEGRRLLTPFDRIVPVAEKFRRAGFKGLAVVNALEPGIELVDFLPAKPGLLPGMALDLGTTHLEASLINLFDGKILARANLENAQIDYGADILTRIHFATRRDKDGPGNGRAVLHDKILSCVNDLAVELARRAGVEATDIRALGISGNTTMVHFFLKLDPYHLCREPYIPMVNSPDPYHAAELGLAIHPASPVWIMPSVGSYFGGDLLAGILATGLDLKKKTCMLIDVGTNAEVVIGNRDWLIACAGAAGPALEGGVVQRGMRAGPGAIEHVHFDPGGPIRYTTVDGGPAKGICGSGLIDLMAALYLARIIDMRAKFRLADSAAPLHDRIVRSGNGPAFVVVPADRSADGKPVMVNQIDLDALMRSKAAMYSILTTLIGQVGLSFTDLHHIYVAGAFGRHIAPRQAITLGMLPDLPLSVYRPVGNSSLAGAEMILTSRRARKRCHKVVKKITYIELNVNQEFMIRFSGSRFIPHTDHDLFPSVPFFND